MKILGNLYDLLSMNLIMRCGLSILITDIVNTKESIHLLDD